MKLKLIAVLLTGAVALFAMPTNAQAFSGKHHKHHHHHHKK
jgi:hypothetical protein